MNRNRSSGYSEYPIANVEVDLVPTSMLSASGYTFDAGGAVVSRHSNIPCCCVMKTMLCASLILQTQV